MKKEAFNPYLPGWEYIPDGEPHVFEGRLYLFGSHDKAGGTEFCPNDYVAWSAPEDDLSDWRYEGIIYRRSQHPGGDSSLKLYAPDVCQGPDGRYYLYYSLQDSGIMSVAVCDRPAGAYEYLGDVRDRKGRVLGTKSEDWFQFDPSVLVDTDGKVWLYSGTGQTTNKGLGHPLVGCFVMELEKDMLTVKAEPRLLLKADYSLFKPSFFEGASARHIGQWYYLVYPATNMTGLNYAMSRYPDRDFVHKGSIHSTSDVGLEGRSFLNARYPVGNNHGGLVCVKGQWYIFDHRMTNNTLFSRQGVAEPIAIKEDGTIDMVEATSCGLNGGPLKGESVYPAYIACNLLKQKGILKRFPYITQEEPDYSPEDGREEAPLPYLCGMKDGTIAGYKYFEFRSIRKIRLLVRGTAKGELRLRTEVKGRKVSALPVHLDSEEWVDIEGEFAPEDGKAAFYIQFRGKGTVDIKEFEFRREGEPYGR